MNILIAGIVITAVGLATILSQLPTLARQRSEERLVKDAQVMTLNVLTDKDGKYAGYNWVSEGTIFLPNPATDVHPIGTWRIAVLPLEQEKKP